MLVMSALMEMRFQINASLSLSLANPSGHEIGLAVSSSSIAALIDHAE